MRHAHASLNNALNNALINGGSRTAVLLLHAAATFPAYAHVELLCRGCREQKGYDGLMG